MGSFSDGSTENLSTQVTWTSSNLAVALVNTSGGISTTGTGSTTIEAAMGSVNDSTTLTVQ
jgi:trimeric autotransporter adhesin